MPIYIKAHFNSMQFLKAAWLCKCFIVYVPFIFPKAKPHFYVFLLPEI